ncbi:hypothetical protein PVAND_017850 [Polypedilum vanderplanki]|uniref:Uncharacterized protein n=1 Tax=Polypedilum vanderplanki TaxID=319348 RepID=A0A9J6B9V5_POLVA|nr:hypothetical protein PVAND_017850 [Polypedilum vanderplanki]
MNQRNMKYFEYNQSCERNDYKIELTDQIIYDMTYRLTKYYLCHKNETILKLATYEWFDVGNCNKQKFKTLNIFDMNTMKWQKPLKNYKKFKNFNGCPIRVVESANIHEDRNKKYLSEYGEFMHIVAEQANFKLKFVNESIENVDINIAYGFVGTHENDAFVVTSPIYTINIGMMVTKGEKYTDYEKLLLPFDDITWILLVGTFFIAFGMIFVLNRMSKRIKILFFGEGVSVPSLNVVSTYFGISQVTLPISNFPRFILMMFILFCLIFRTAYQGVLFEFMNSDMRKPHAQTIDEIFENNYTIISYESPTNVVFKRIYKNDKEKLKNVILVDLYRKGIHRDICNILKNDVPKTAILTEENFDLKVKFICKQEIIRIKDTIFTINVGISMEAYHYLYDVIESSLLWTLQSGIVQYFSEFYTWYEYKRYHIEESSVNKILSLNDLSYGFNIWLIVCAVAIVEFFFELVIGKITKKSQKPKDTEIINEEKDENLTSKINELEEDFDKEVLESLENLFSQIVDSENEESIEIEKQEIEVKVEVYHNNKNDEFSIQQSEKSNENQKSQSGLQKSFEEEKFTDIATIVDLR